MRVEDLRFFAETVRCKSLNKASTALYITQPALGTAIQSFENDLGMQLLYRSSSGIKPTIFGRKLYQECLPLLEEIDQYFSRWQEEINFFQSVEGTVEIGVFPLMSPFLATSFAQELSLLCPKIQLSVTDFPMRHDLEKYLTGSCSIVIGVLEIDAEAKYRDILSKAKDLNLELTILGRDELKALINAKNKCAKKGYLNQEDFQNMNNITYAPSERENIYDPHSESHIIYAHTPDQIFQMIQANLGFFIAGEKIAGTHFAVQNGLIKALDIHGANLPSIYLYMIHRPSEQLSDCEKAVVQALKYCCNDGSAEDFPY